MKTTLDLPDELMRAVKMRAVREDRRLKDVIAELLRAGLAEDREAPRPGHRVKLPLIHVPHAAAPGKELTPERIAEILIEQEADWASGR